MVKRREADACCLIVCLLYASALHMQAAEGDIDMIYVGRVSEV